MKKNIIYLLAAVAMTFTSCLDDSLPQTNAAIADQVAKADKIGLVNGLIQYMNTPVADESQYVYTGIGYPEHMVWHDIMTQDLPVLSTSYNYWTAYGQCLYLGNWAWQSYYWSYYNYLIYKATLVIKNCTPGNPDDAMALATALAYRAYITFEMTRMYEYRPTGTSLDATYCEDLKGLTVPVINEYSDEEMAQDNPRVPFYEMYRYILNDLLGAKEAIEMTSETNPKNFASPGMVYGQLARFWMELGSRFERHPEDLDIQKAHDDEQFPLLGEGYQKLPPIGINSARDAFAKAADYARMAINSGYSPLTRNEWFDVTTGFNTANSSWIWGILISSSDKMVTYYTWESWASYMCPEAGWGIASPTYRGTFMIDAKLFGSIGKGDWRRLTWVDPADWIADNASESEEADFEETFNSKYAPVTQLDFDSWRKLGPYVGFKFRPGSGNTSSSITGNKVDIPLMRVEEMYFIEAEAVAHTQGVAAGANLLSSFMNTYRYTDGSYKCKASNLRDFEVEMLIQKRIEFWGEGLCLFDYKRLELPIERGYEGSNHPSSYQFNSLDGYVAPWTILYIPLNEQQQNKALKLNPDPSGIMSDLKF